MSFGKVLQAASRISAHIHRTPVHACKTLNELVNRQVYFKCENFQKTGSFKARGALNAVLSLGESSRSVIGVVAHSSGNHGQALAWAASITDIKCAIVVPDDTPAVKCDAIKEYGAELIFCDRSPQSRIETCNQIERERGYINISPYDDNDGIAGTGTIAVEFLQHVPDLDAILVPISGGGLASGIAIATKRINPVTKIFAVEPKGKELETSLRARRRMWPNPSGVIDTIADGNRTQQCGYITFPILLDKIEKDVFSVTDAEIVEAMKFTWQRMKLVIEPAAGLGVAAVMSEKMRNMDSSMKKVGVILCGGNVDIDKLPWR